MWSSLPGLARQGEEDELRELAMHELEAVGGKDYRAPQFQEACDRTNTVHVTVGRSGAVKDVQVRGDWRREIGGHGFGPALLEAYENANLAMMNAVALSALAEQERARAAPAVRRPPEEILSYIPETDISQIWQMLSDVEDLMSRTDDLGRAAPDEVRTVHGPCGYLTAKCSGAAVTSITADPSRAGQAEAEQLRREALELFRAAEGWRTF